MGSVIPTNDARERPIDFFERSGVLYPERLARYQAGWIEPDPSLLEVVDQYWHVSWALDDGERLEQPIIDLPAITASIEEGDVPADLVVTGVQSRAWQRTIHGRGHVFSIRLRPAGLAVISELAPTHAADATLPLTPELDPRLHGLMQSIATHTEPAERARAADRALGEALADRPPSPSGLLANKVLDELRERVHHRTGPPLADGFSCSQRTIQRACFATLGHGPKWLSRRIRLQEVTLALAARSTEDLAAIAADLGYSDQSHLTHDFRAATGITPDAYRRTVSRLISGHGHE